MKTLSEMRAELRVKKVSSVELVQDALAKAKTHAGAYLTITDKQALAEARAADEARAQGKETLLGGLPVALKDLFLQEGVRTTAGSRILENFIAPYDATVVKNLLRRTAASALARRTWMNLPAGVFKRKFGVRAGAQSMGSQANTGWIVGR